MTDYDDLLFIHATQKEVAADSRRALCGLVAIGERLIEIQSRMAHFGNGVFVEWLRSELKMSVRAAYNYMALAKVFGDVIKDDGAKFNVSAKALYALAAPSTPVDARNEVTRLARSGVRITFGKAKKIIDAYDKPLPNANSVDSKKYSKLTADFRAKERASGQYYPCILRLENPDWASLIQRGQYVVYGLVDPRDNTVFYIGQTCQFYQRMTEHCRIYPFGHRRTPLEERKYAIFEANLAVTIRILSLPDSQQEALDAEYRHIKENCHTLLNVQQTQWMQIER